MLTCKSPRKVLRVGFGLARDALPKYSSKFSRKDFTLPQLFACLVVREQLGLDYRGTEALLNDSPHWCREIGMSKVPDHNTLCRAFHVLHLSRRGKLLDMLVQWFAIAKQLGDTAAVDSTVHDTHHRSRHYEQRCRHYAAGRGKLANTRRSRSARRSPKLSFAVDTRSHLILSARPRSGLGSDAPEFAPLLFDAWRRMPGKRLKHVLADAGFDSEANHRSARLDMAVCSWIKTGIGRRTTKPPAAHYRRLMYRKLAGSQKGKRYGQRAQAETAASMLKRNLGDALRSRSDRARRDELMLRVITHGIMLPRLSKRRVETEPVRPRFIPSGGFQH